MSRTQWVEAGGGPNSWEGRCHPVKEASCLHPHPFPPGTALLGEDITPLIWCWGATPCLDPWLLLLEAVAARTPESPCCHPLASSSAPQLEPIAASIAASIPASLLNQCSGLTLPCPPLVRWLSRSIHTGVTDTSREKKSNSHPHTLSTCFSWTWCMYKQALCRPAAQDQVGGASTLLLLQCTGQHCHAKTRQNRAATIDYLMFLWGKAGCISLRGTVLCLGLYI